MKYYCKGCNIKGIQISTKKPAKTDAEGNRYCIVVDAKLNEYCPCHDCMLMVSCTKICDRRHKLRGQSFSIVGFRLTMQEKGKSDDTM